MALKKALTDIADKIRFYTGKTDKLSLSDMPAEIENVYEAGQGEIDFHLQRLKKAILGRGGEIASDAGIEALSEAIFNIHADASLAHYTDDGIAYRKNVPVGSAEYALLKSVGGITYKSNNLIPYPYTQTTKTEDGITFTDNGDGSVTLNGTATETFIVILSKTIKVEDGTYTVGKISDASNKSGVYAQLFYKASDGSYPTQNISNQPVTLTMSKGIVYSFQLVVEKGVTVSNVTIYPMLNKGTALPYEPYYEGLRDSKVTELLSVGANLFPLLPWANRTISGVTFSLDESGVYHLSGTATENLFAALKVNLPVGEYTLSLNCNKQIGTGFADAVYATARSADGEWRIVHSTHSPNTYTTSTTTVDIVDVTFAIMEGVNCDGLTVAPMLNRGDYIPYAPYHEPISYPIPKALQDLEGLGRGLRSASSNLTTQRDFYNICDFSTKQYTQWVSETITIDGENVKAVELGSTTGEIRIDLRTQTGKYADYTALQLTKFTPSLSKTPNTAYLTAQGSSLRVYLFTTETFATVEEANEWLKANPIEVIYAFIEPVITDISDILTGDNFIEVESGGSLEFVNEHKNAVPSTIKYTVKVGS